MVYSSSPQKEVVRTLKAGVPDSIGEAILWATVKTLDMMAEVTKVRFLYSPVVATELFNFMALNTGLDAVEN